MTRAWAKQWVVVASVIAFLLGGCGPGAEGEAVDEALAAGKTVKDFQTARYDYFRDMDMTYQEPKDGKPGLHVLGLSPDEIKGRNTWLMWCGGKSSGSLSIGIA